jgi:hypothetical protein
MLEASAFGGSDGAMVVRALWGVSSSPPMPKYPEYVAAVAELKRRVGAYNPPGNELGTALDELVTSRRSTVTAEFPWTPATVTWPRMLAAVTSFTDDYTGPYPDEFFSRSQVYETTRRLTRQSSVLGRPLTIPEQLAISLDVCDDSAFAASATLHAASRMIARGRDMRALPALRLDLRHRLTQGATFAAFCEVDSKGGDPLGDTYHYWAMVVGGMWCGDVRRVRSVASRATAALFRNGADLMWLVRDRLFGSPLFFGRHKAIDRLGFDHGWMLAAKARRV